MLTTRDKGKHWCATDGHILKCEDGSVRALTTNDVMFTHGKYEGEPLSEVSNSWYLKMMMERNEEDYLMQTMIGERLKEL